MYVIVSCNGTYLSVLKNVYLISLGLVKNSFSSTKLKGLSSAGMLGVSGTVTLIKHSKS